MRSRCQCATPPGKLKSVRPSVLEAHGRTSPDGGSCLGARRPRATSPVHLVDSMLECTTRQATHEDCAAVSCIRIHDWGRADHAPDEFVVTCVAVFTFFIFVFFFLSLSLSRSLCLSLFSSPSFASSLSLSFLSLPHSPLSKWRLTCPACMRASD